jgi:hypothetical protein
MTQQGAVAPPNLTLPPEEAEAVRQAYAGARVVLEYGSGGSTVIAGENPEATIYSVESDADWAAMMQRWFVENPPKGRVIVHHADIGPTREWGQPVNNRHVSLWPGYPNSVWDRADFQNPDTVLIDGRFRLACFLTVLFRAERPVKVLWDDYMPRPAYHLAERLCSPVASYGRMVEFYVEPQRLAPRDLPWVAEAFVTPQ